MVIVFLQGLSRSVAAAMELLGDDFGGVVVSNRFSVCNHLPLHQRPLCWAQVIRDLMAIAARQRDRPSNSRGIQFANGAICRSRLLPVTTTLRQQGCDVWQFLEPAWIADHRGGVMPSWFILWRLLEQACIANHHSGVMPSLLLDT